VQDVLCCTRMAPLFFSEGAKGMHVSAFQGQQHVLFWCQGKKKKETVGDAMERPLSVFVLSDLKASMYTAVQGVGSVKDSQSLD
jgi:hypothetical protein